MPRPPEPKFDLDKLDAKGLRKLIDKAQRLLEKKEASEKTKFLRQMKKEAAARGLDFADVVKDVAEGKTAAQRTKAAPQKPTKAKKSVPPKYRHPKNPELTWSGRGRMPAWVREYKDAGKLDEIKINS